MFAELYGQNYNSSQKWSPDIIPSATQTRNNLSYVVAKVMFINYVTKCSVDNLDPNYFVNEYLTDKILELSKIWICFDWLFLLNKFKIEFKYCWLKKKHDSSLLLKTKISYNFPLSFLCGKCNYCFSYNFKLTALANNEKY